MSVLSQAVQTLIGQGVSVVKFSVTSPPIVPGLQYVLQQPQLVLGQMTNIPTQHLRFQELCVSDSDYSVNTIWGEAEGAVYNDEYLLRGVSFEGFPGSGEDSFTYKFYHNISNDPNDRVVQISNDISYTSAVSLFAISQSFNICTELSGDEYIIPEPSRLVELEISANENSSFAIAFGMKLLKIAGKEKIANGNQIWKKIMDSMEKDKVTPLTAFLLAHLISIRLHDQPQMFLEAFEEIEEDRAYWKKRDKTLRFDRLPADVRLHPQEDKPLWIRSVEEFDRDFGYFGYVPPLISIYYIPPGNYGKSWSEYYNVALQVFGFEPDFPTIVIAQNMSIYDNKPFASPIGDLVAAAKTLQPALPFDPAE